MITLVIIKNPFDTSAGREISSVDELNTGILRKQWEPKFGEVNITVNGFKVENDIDCKDNDFVTVCPVVAGGGGGKSILGVVAMVALAVVSGGIASGAMFGAGFAATFGAAAGTWQLIAATAVMFIGSSLVQKSFYNSNSVDYGSYDYENNSTYSWSGCDTMEGQNNPIALTYGTVQSGGQTLGKFISVSGNDEVLNWLIGCGEGPLSISNIRLNDNAVSYYDNITCEIRSGTNDQAIISNFNDTYFTKSLSYELKGTTARTDTAQGNATQGLEVKIECPQGLYYANDSGGMDTAWVKIAVYYRLAGSSTWTSFWSENAKALSGNPAWLSLYGGGAVAGSYSLVITYDEYDEDYKYVITYPNGKTYRTWSPDLWTDVTVGDFYISGRNKSTGTYNFSVYEYTRDAYGTISGAQNNAIRTTYRKDNITAGTYEVMVQVVGRSHSETSSRACVKTYWTGLTSIVYDDFIYPNIALIGIKGLATAQISGSPSLKFLKTRDYVWVWNGTEYVQKPSDNPAWASYDCLHMCNKIKNINTGEYEFEARGVPAASILYDQFNEWAQWCDAHNKKVNIEIAETGEMLNTINKNIAGIGHGLVVRFGTRYGCVWDRVQEPTQMFGMGNIIAGSFQEQFLKTSDRANCVEITYTDKEADYARQTITVYSDSYDTDAEEKVSQITYNGITDYKQAYAEGKYQMYCNQYLKRTVSFDCGVDALACTLGDVVLVAHDVPKWAYSGRIYAIYNETVTLPVEVESLTASYILQFRTAEDGLIEVPVTMVSSVNGYTVVSLNETPTKQPKANDIFALALVDYGCKPFVVKNVTRKEDLKVHLDLLEYNESIYNEDYTIPEIEYSHGTSTKAEDVTGLSASQVAFTDKNGNKKSKMFVSWNSAGNGVKYSVLYSTDNKYYKTLVSSTYNTSVSGEVEPYNTYYVKVISIVGLSQSKGAIIYPVPPGEDVLPPNVTELNVETLSDGTRRYYWKFDYPDPNDIAGFRIKYIQGQYALWPDANEVQGGLVTNMPYEAQTVRSGQHIVMIKAVDYAGNESPKAAVCYVDFGDLLEENVLHTIRHHENGWEAVLGGNYHWEAENSSYWKKPNNHFWVSLENGYIDEHGWIRPQEVSNFWTKPEDNFWKTPDTPFWQDVFLPLKAEFSFMALASGYWWMKYEITGAATIWYKINEDGIFKQYSGRVRVEAGDKITIRFTSEKQDAAIKTAESIIDVPDKEEHFYGLTITTAGITLPIKCPNYYTTAVRIDSLPLQNNEGIYPKIVSRNPCILRLVNKEGTPVSSTADITWQGFEREVLE